MPANNYDNRLINLIVGLLRKILEVHEGKLKTKAQICISRV